MTLNSGKYVLNAITSVLLLWHSLIRVLISIDKVDLFLFYLSQVVTLQKVTFSWRLSRKLTYAQLAKDYILFSISTF